MEFLQLFIKFLYEAEGLAFSIPAILSVQLFYISELVLQRRYNSFSVVIQVFQMKERQKQSSKVPVESFPLQDKKPHMKCSASYALKQVDTQRFSVQQ